MFAEAGLQLMSSASAAYRPAASAAVAAAARRAGIARRDLDVPQVPLLLPIAALLMLAASIVFFETGAAPVSLLG